MTNNEIISLAKETANKHKELLETLPYSANIITELHANENAHSRILRLLLEYNRNGKFSIFESFIKNIINNKINIEIKEPRFTNETERIDILIEDSNRYAIIIENKVCDADDQEAQLERYIKKCAEHGIDNKNIYVLYLTKDGIKEVTDYSLTARAKKALDYTEESNGRFFPVNYNDNILPWLEKEIYPNIPTDEKLLASFLEQYKDYLKGMLELRDEDIAINKKMEDFVVKKLSEFGINSFSQFSELYSDFEELYEQLESKKDKCIEEIGKEKILKPLKKKLSNVEFVEDECSFEGGGIWIAIKNKRMIQSHFMVSTESDNSVIYGIKLDDRNNPLPKRVQNSINTKMKELGFRKSPLWPCFKSVEPVYKYPDLDFWKKVDSGELKPADYFAQCYYEVMDNLKGIAL